MIATEKINVTVADHRPAVLAGLQEWFDSQERYRVVGLAANADQLFHALAMNRGDLIVMSCEINGVDFGVLLEVRQRYPDVPTVIFTSLDDGHALRAMQLAGAAGVVSSHDGPNDFERLCSRVLSGAHGVVSRRVAALCEASAAAEATPQAQPEPSPQAEPVRSFNAYAPYQNVKVSIAPLVARSGSRQNEHYKIPKNR